MSSSRLRLGINALGALVLAVHAVLAALSYVQAPALWRIPEARRAREFFDDLGSQAFEVTADPATWLAASHWFESTDQILLSYFIPLAIATFAAVAMMLLLMQSGAAADDRTARLLRRWSMAFALVCAFAFPVFTQDFWLSAAWGRMTAAGVNPYHNLYTAEFLRGLPLDHFPMPMSYGPLWAMISAAVSVFAWGNVWATAVLFKAVIAAAWIGALMLTDRAMREKPVRDRCLALAIVGWVPLSVTQSVAEGHNDIVMIAAAVLWLVLLLRGHWTAPVALAASVLCKYATAPLIVIDLVAAFRRDRLSVRDSVLRLLLPALLGLFGLALFFRSFAFFDGMRLVSEWYFLRPSEAVSGIQALVGLPLYPLQLLALAIVPAIAVYWTAAACAAPTGETITKATIATVAAIMFAAVSHLWPWYLVWGIAFAALLPRWWLSRFLTGVAILAPFTLATWWGYEDYRDVAATAMYAGAALWTLLTRERTAQS